MNPLLAVHNLHLSLLSKEHPPLPLLENISFSLHAGEMVALVGESGCGKSMLSKTLLKLFPPKKVDISGQILYKGANLVPYTELQMRSIRGKKIALVLQDPYTSLNPTIAVGRQILESYHIAHPSASKQEGITKMLEILQAIGIENPLALSKAYPHTLSGGMQQRALLAMALISDPEILLADEITSALDVRLQLQILSLLRDIQKARQLSVLFITHDLALAAEFCDRMLIMQQGKLVYNAPTQEIHHCTTSPYIERLLFSFPSINPQKTL